MSPLTAFTNGIYKENPIFRLVLGLCPTIAVSLAVSNGIGMGLDVYKRQGGSRHASP